MTKDEALRLALEALENHCGNYKLDDAGCERWNKAVAAIKEALAQPEQKPVEDVVAYHSDGTRTVRIAPKRPWVKLTDEERVSFEAANPKTQEEWDELFNGIEAALRSKKNMKEEWLFRGALVPIDAETTAALVAEIKRLIDVVGGMVLTQGPDYERGFIDGMSKQAQSSVDKAVNAMTQPSNFCPRCGKRRGGDVNYIHTCTPPRGLEMT